MSLFLASVYNAHIICCIIQFLKKDYWNLMMKDCILKIFQIAEAVRQAIK